MGQNLIFCVTNRFLTQKMPFWVRNRLLSQKVPFWVKNRPLSQKIALRVRHRLLESGMARWAGNRPSSHLVISWFPMIGWGACTTVQRVSMSILKGNARMRSVPVNTWLSDKHPGKKTKHHKGIHLCCAGSGLVSGGGSFLPFYMASVPSADSPSPKWALVLINLLILWNAVCGCMVSSS